MARQGRLRAGVGSGSEWEWQVAGGRKEEPGRCKNERTQNRKKQETKEGKGYGRNGDGNVKVDFLSI